MVQDRCIVSIRLSWSRDHDHVPFRDDLSSAGWDMLWLTYQPNLNFVAVMEIWNVLQNLKMGWFRVVRGHPRSLAMSPFDRVRMISCSSLIETIHLSCTVFKIQRVICGNSPTSTYPTCVLRPHLGWPLWILKRFSASENWAILQHCLCVSMFSHFSRTPTCDRQTHTQTGPWCIPHRA